MITRNKECKHILSKYSDDETRTLVNCLISTPYIASPYYLPDKVITVDKKYDSHFNFAINFINYCSVIVLDMNDIEELRPGQLYTLIHLWAESEEISDIGVLHRIKTAIGKDYYDAVFLPNWDFGDADSKYCNLMFEKLLSKLPNEIVLQYYAEYGF